MSTYWIIMIIGVPLVIGGWIVYFVWDYRQRKEEEKQPKPQAQQVKKAKSEISDWAKKMAEFKGPPKRPAEGEKPRSG